MNEDKPVVEVKFYGVGPKAGKVWEAKHHRAIVKKARVSTGIGSNPTTSKSEAKRFRKACNE